MLHFYLINLKLFSVKYDFDLDEFDIISTNAKDFVSQLLINKMCQRMTASQVKPCCVKKELSNIFPSVCPIDGCLSKILVTVLSKLITLENSWQEEDGRDVDRRLELCRECQVGREK